MSYAGFSGMVVTFYGSSAFDTAFRVEYSCIPIGDIGSMELNISGEARDAIVNCALSEILGIPGQHQNIWLASQKKMEYEQQKAALIALGVLGMGGASVYKAPNFVPNTGRLWPYYFQPLIPPGN